MSKGQKKIAIITLLISEFILFSGCGTHPVLPEAKDIKVSREAPKASCKSLGFIEGRVNRVSAKTEEAIEDMKQEAIRKGANYVKMETIGALGGSVRGEAFYCE